MDPKLIDKAFVACAARGVGLEIHPAHMPGVVSYFQLIAGMAESVSGFPLDETAEHAAIFTPCSPPTQG